MSFVDQNQMCNGDLNRRSTQILILLLLLNTIPSISQVDNDKQRLRFAPGARQQSMAYALTAVVDELPAISLNPALLGFARQWQWSASYNRWDDDLDQISFLTSRRLNFIGSPHTTGAIGLTYSRMPEFDITDQASAVPDLIGSITLGQRLGAGPVAIGTTVKYLHKKSNDKKRTVVADVGVILHPKRFSLFGSGSRQFSTYLSAGFSVLNIGSDVRNFSIENPLQETWRAGMALHAGKHHGIQLTMATDISKMKSGKLTKAIGFETSWNDWMSVRLGYIFGRNVEDNFTLGFGLRFGNRLNFKDKQRANRNRETRVDVASIGRRDGDNSDVNYGGTLNHYSIRPESFYVINPVNHFLFYNNNPLLQWSTSIDPDPFDSIRYLILVSDDSLRMRRAISALKTNLQEFLKTSSAEDFLVFEIITSNNYRLKEQPAGNYFWTVLAFDNDYHFSFASDSSEHLLRFRVADQTLFIPMGLPPKQWMADNTDIAVKSIVLQPSQRITTTPEQGIVQVTIENLGPITVDSLRVILVDRFVAAPDSARSLFTTKDGFQRMSADNDTLVGSQVLKDLTSNEESILEFAWQTVQQGSHILVAMIDKSENVPEIDESNNRLMASISTIPKGTIDSPPLTIALNVNEIRGNIPFNFSVNFAKQSSQIDYDYFQSWPLDPPIQFLATRLIENPSMAVELQGYADSLSGEYSIDLANQRSASVRDELISAGASSNQIREKPGKFENALFLPKSAKDRDALLRERRRVDIFVEDSLKSFLLTPIHMAVIDSSFTPVGFNIDIKSGEHLSNAWVYLTRSPEITDTLDIPLTPDSSQISLKDTVDWNIADSPQPAAWLGKTFSYQLCVRDAEGRLYYTPKATARLESAWSPTEEQIFIFEGCREVKPLDDFYLGFLFSKIDDMLRDSDMRVRFVGHACSIGTKDENQRLSQLRASVLRDIFLNEIRNRLPEHYLDLQDRVDLAIGLGDSTPLKLKMFGSLGITLGDNKTPLGRRMNRRVDVIFYKPAGQSFE